MAARKEEKEAVDDIENNRPQESRKVTGMSTVEMLKSIREGNSSDEEDPFDYSYLMKPKFAHAWRK